MPRLSESENKPAKHEMPLVWSGEVDDWATCLSWSSDALVCAVGSASGSVRLFDGRTGSVLQTLAAHPGGVLDLAFSPKKRLLATAGQDGTAKLWSSSDGALVANLPGTTAWAERVTWCPDGKKLATASGKTVRLWTAEGAPLLETEPHESTVTGLAFSRKGSDLATSCYGGIRVFRIAAGGKSKHHAWKGSIISLAWSPDDRVIVCGAQDCSIHFWRLPSGKDSFMEGYRSKPKELAWSADSRLLATGGEAVVTVWDFGGKGPEGTEPILLSGHLALVTDLCFDRRGTLLASGAQDTGVLVWDPRRSQEPLGFAFLREQVSKIGFRPNHDQLTGIDAAGTVACWALPA
jgi:WD40 repeat protein